MRLFASLVVALTLSLSRATDVTTQEKLSKKDALDHHHHKHHHHHHNHDHRGLQKRKGENGDSYTLCGTPDGSMREVKKVDEALSKWLKEHGKAPLIAENHVTTIETYWHSIAASDTTGGISADAILDTINHLNNVFSTNGFEFDLRGITQTNNDDYYFSADVGNRVDFNMKASTRVGNQAVLNIWSVGSTESFALEYATYPWDYGFDPIRDGVVFMLDTATGGPFPEFDQGDVLVHAIGHWLGLLHPFEGFSCLNPGDFVEDTPPQAEPIFGCPTSDPPNFCGAGSNYQNYMDFTDDPCKIEFTPGQAERMAIAWDLFRAPGLLPNAPTVAPVTLFPTPTPPVSMEQGCLAAVPLSIGAIVSSTTDGAQRYESMGCGGTYDLISPGNWYKVTGDGRQLAASLCGNSAYDTMISVWTGPCSRLTCVAGNDDFCGLQSGVEFTALNGVDYLIYVHGYGGQSGAFDLSITAGTLPPTPVTVFPTFTPFTFPPTVSGEVLPLEAGCEVATTLSVDSSVFSSTVGTPRYQTRPCGVSEIVSSGLWYKVIGTGDTITAATCDYPGFDTMISVWQGPCSQGLSCVDGSDDACGDLQSRVTWSSMAGAEYYIFVHGFFGQIGDFDLTITSGALPPSSFTTFPTYSPFTSFPTYGGEVIPFEDACPTATSLTINGPTVFSTTRGTPRYQTRFCEGAFELASPGVWYKVTGNGDSLIASLCGTSNYDTMISVWTGPCSQLTCVTGTDDSYCGLESVVDWNSMAGVQYYIFVHGFAGQAGDFGINVYTGSLTDFPTFGPNTPAPSPTTTIGTLLQGCQSAIGIALGAVYSDSTVFSTVYGVPGCGSALATTSPGQWFSVVGEGAPITASLCGPNDYFDNMISVWRVVGGCENVNCITGNDDSCGLSSEVTFMGEEGFTYLIYVHGFLGGAGDFQLVLSTQTPSPTPEPTNRRTPAPTIAPTSDCIFGFPLLNRAAGFFGF